LTTKNGNEKTYYFDLVTNLIYKEETTTKQQGQEVKSSVKYLDYKTLENGIKMAFKSDMGMMMMVTNKVTINPTIDETIFFWELNNSKHEILNCCPVFRHRHAIACTKHSLF
jgi:hypothetical protein